MLKFSDKEKGSFVFVSRVKEFVARKERELGRSIENREIAGEINVAEHTVGAWLKPREFRTADAEVVGALAAYFGVEWYELLVLKPSTRTDGKRRGRPAGRKKPSDGK
jgi:hypothetical protein